MRVHSQALNGFARKLLTLLMLRGAVRWVTVWFFVWGVVVLAARFAHLLNSTALLFGLFGAVPLAGLAVAQQYRNRIAFSKVRAAYDGMNRCGGVVMAEEVEEMSAWQAVLPPAASPALRWRGGESLGLFGLSVAFVAVTLLLPDRLTTLAEKPLEIGKLVGELRAEVETLKQEKILDPNKADEMQKQLERLKEQSSAIDPSKTWEALDHIKESNSDVARQAAEEAISKTTCLTDAQTLAGALQLASESGLGQDTATRAAQDLAAMLKSAKLEDGLLNAEIPPELLSQLSSMNQEDLARLMSAIQSSKTGLGRTMTNLAKLKLIDAKSLSQCKNAGQCPNPDALAAFLCQNTNCNSFSAAAISYGRGGVDRGRGDAPMTWKDESTDAGAKFKEQALPASDRFSDSQFVGVSRTAPELSGEAVVAGHGALASAAASGGAAHSQVILPRHKQAVQSFFKREE
jgi:Sec-independent protein translocase protein TatA